MTRLAIYAFSKRWGWLVAGLIVLAFGGVLFAQAHVVVPTEISGTLASAQDILQNSSYDHTEVHLAGDSNTYTFNMNDMSPVVTDNLIYLGGKIDLWIDKGTTNVVALQLYGQNDNNPVKYASDVYYHPDHALSTGRTNGEIIGGIGAFLVLVGLAWPIFPWGRKKAPARRPAMVGAGSRTQANIQNAYGRSEPGGAYPPRQPGYGQQPAQQPGWPRQPNQPGYGPPSQYGQQNQPSYPQPGEYGRPNQPSYPQRGQYGQPNQPSYPQPGQYGPPDQYGQYGQPGAQSGWGQQDQPPYGPAGGQRPRQPDQGGWGR